MCTCTWTGAGAYGSLPANISTHVCRLLSVIRNEFRKVK